MSGALLEIHGCGVEAVLELQPQHLATKALAPVQQSVWMDKLLNSRGRTAEGDGQRKTSTSKGAAGRSAPHGGISRNIDGLQVNTPERSPLACHR